MCGNPSPDVGTVWRRIMNQRKIYELIERFEKGRTSVTNESRPGRPSTSRTDEHIQRVAALIREDRRLTLARVAVRLAL
jgi:transposase